MNRRDHEWKMIFLLLALITNLISGSELSTPDRENSFCSQAYQQLHVVITLYEHEAHIYYTMAQECDDCLEELQNISEALRCRTRTPLQRVEELQVERQRVLVACNKLERARIDQLQVLKCILGDNASSVYDYYHAMEYSMNTAFRRALRRGNWRRIVSLRAALDKIARAKSLIVQIFLEQITASSNPRDTTFVSRRRSSEEPSGKSSMQ